MKRLIDSLAPKEDQVQIILKRRGKPVAGIYVDGDQEIRSPKLKDLKHDPTPRND